LEKGANLHYVNDGWNPLSAAAVDGCFEIFKFLLERGADINSLRDGIFCLLKRRLQYDRLLKIEIAIEKGIKLRVKNAANKTPLMKLIEKCDLDIFREFKCLVEAGADIHSVNNLGNTVLMRACGIKHTCCKNIVKLLVEKNVDLEVKNHEGQTVLMIAKFYRNMKVVDFLERKISERDSSFLLAKERYATLLSRLEKGEPLTLEEMANMADTFQSLLRLSRIKE
jgi:ankyrin repeat protein